MLTKVEGLRLGLLVLRPLEHVLDSEVFEHLGWFRELDVVYREGLFAVVYDEQGDYLAAQHLVRRVFEPLDAVDVLVREDDHQVLLQVKVPERNQLLLIAQVIVVRTEGVAGLELVTLGVVKRVISGMGCPLELKSSLGKLRVLLEHVQARVENVVGGVPLDVPLPVVGGVRLQLHLAHLHDRVDLLGKTDGGFLVGDKIRI